jgi:hypothetical protein
LICKYKGITCGEMGIIPHTNHVSIMYLVRRKWSPTTCHFVNIWQKSSPTFRCEGIKKWLSPTTCHYQIFDENQNPVDMHTSIMCINGRTDRGKLIDPPTLSRGGIKIFCHIQTRYVYRKYIYIFMRISRVLCFFQTLLWFKLYNL